MLVFILLVLSVLITVCYLQKTYNYWSARGVKQLPTHFLWGHAQKLKLLSLSEILQETYDHFKNTEVIAGLYVFTKPVAVILDLDLVRHILIKDFNVFVDRHPFEDEEILTKHLFRVGANIWKNLRKKLTPTFTSGKMKFMFPTMLEVAEKFAKAFEEERLMNANHYLDVRDINSRYIIEVIGSCIFGLEGNGLNDPNDQLRVMGKRLFKPRNDLLHWALFKRFYGWVKYFGVDFIPKSCENFFVNLTMSTVSEREKLQIKRRDFIDILIDLNNNPNKMEALGIDLMAAQLFGFFIAGYETSSSTMSYCLYELAQSAEIQEKVREEILNVLAQHDNQITYEAVMSMTYLEQVIKETLRLYPALASLQRIAMQNYKIPGTNIVLEKGTVVLIPVKAIHYDPKIYEKPNEFHPERFDPENVKQRHPLAFLGFGDGPRNCIGARFGLLQVHIGLITLLSKYRFSSGEIITTQRFGVSKTHLVSVPAKEVILKAEKL